MTSWWFVCFHCTPEALGKHYLAKEEVSVQSRMTAWWKPEKCDHCKKWRWHLFEFYEGLSASESRVEPSISALEESQKQREESVR